MSHVLFVLAVTASMSSGQYLSKPCELLEQLVKTNQGVICGVERSSTLGAPEDPQFSYVAYQGIPFAQPPLGKLRFKNPLAGLPWEGVRDGNWSVPVCPQPDGRTSQIDRDIYGDEDCLYLNVYTPKSSGANLKDLPVMAWLHGGGLRKGGASSQDPQFFMTKDVIVVLIQYRLGYLGLLSTEDDAAPGNLVLKDQALALQWIKDNIEAFGGDKDKVTLFGVSAGAHSAHLQMLNPKAKGLFSKVILQSGTGIYKSFFKHDDHREVTGLLAKSFGCVNEEPGIVYDSQQVVTCLQNVAPKDLVFAHKQFAKFRGFPQHFGFRIGDEVIPEHPAKLLKDGKYHMVDLIAGVNSHEEAGSIKEWYDTPNLLDDIAANFSSIGHMTMEMLPSENHAARELYNYYLGGVRKYTDEDAPALVQLYSNLIYGISTDISLQLHARDTLYGRNIFAYEFQHRGQYSRAGESAPHLGLNGGPAHGDELQYMFEMSEEAFKTLERKEDLQMRKIMLELWTNFAKYGNPTPDRSHGFTWQPVGLESLSHLALKLKSHMEPDKRCEIRSFFSTLDLYESVNRILFPGQLAAGKHWRPWRIQDTQNQCGA